MRICYQIPGAMGATEEGRQEMSRRRAWLRARGLGAPEVDVRHCPDGPASVESAEAERIAAGALLDEVSRLQAEAYDAVIIGCFGDPGLEAAQASLSAPVIGPAAASLHLAAQVADAIGILTVMPEVVPTLQALVMRYGMAATVRDIRAVEVPVLQLRERRDEVLERLRLAAVQQADLGVGVVVLGCMTMGFLDLDAELARDAGVNVVNPALAALHTAEALAAA